MIDSCIFFYIDGSYAQGYKNDQKDGILAKLYNLIETCVRTKLNSKQQVNFLSIHKKMIHIIRLSYNCTIC